MIIQKHNITSFKFYIDLVIIRDEYKTIGESIQHFSSKWPVHCSMRNVICHINDQNNIVIEKLKNGKLCVKMARYQKELTVNWLLESMKYIAWKEKRKILYGQQLIHDNSEDSSTFNVNQILNSVIFAKKNYEYFKVPYKLLEEFIKFSEFSKLNENKKDDCCVICQEELGVNGPPTSVASLKCGCAFHSSCIVSMLIPFVKDYIGQINRCIEYNASGFEEPMVYQNESGAPGAPIGPIGLRCPNCRNQIFNRLFGRKVPCDMPGIIDDFVISS